MVSFMQLKTNFRDFYNRNADWFINTWDSPSEVYSWFKTKRSLLDAFRKEIERTNGVFCVLDLGCGKGEDIFVLNKLFEDKKVFFVGVDVDVEKVRKANCFAVENGFLNCLFFQGDVERVKFNRLFDFVICSEVLEHLGSPKKGVLTAFNNLKRGGKLFVSTPIEDNYLKKFRFFKETVKNKKDFELFEEEHTSVLRVNELKRLLVDCGFKLEFLRRGSLFYGGEWLDSRLVMFIFMLLVDCVLPKEWLIKLSWNLTLKAERS